MESAIKRRRIGTPPPPSPPPAGDVEDGEHYAARLDLFVSAVAVAAPHLRTPQDFVHWTMTCRAARAAFPAEPDVYHDAPRPDRTVQCGKFCVMCRIIEARFPEAAAEGRGRGPGNCRLRFAWLTEGLQRVPCRRCGEHLALRRADRGYCDECIGCPEDAEWPRIVADNFRSWGWRDHEGKEMTRCGGSYSALWRESELALLHRILLCTGFRCVHPAHIEQMRKSLLGAVPSCCMQTPIKTSICACLVAICSAEAAAVDAVRNLRHARDSKGAESKEARTAEDALLDRAVFIRHNYAHDLEAIIINS